MGDAETFLTVSVQPPELRSQETSGTKEGNQRRCSHSFKVYCTLLAVVDWLDRSAKSNATTPCSPLDVFIVRLVLAALRSAAPLIVFSQAVADPRRLLRPLGCLG